MSRPPGRPLLRALVHRHRGTLAVGAGAGATRSTLPLLTAGWPGVVLLRGHSPEAGAQPQKGGSSGQPWLVAGGVPS